MIYYIRKSRHFWHVSMKGRKSAQKGEIEKMLESKIEARLKDRVREIGGRCVKWVSPGWSGVPDRIILLPEGRIAFAELKQRGKKEEPLQRRRHAQLREMGFTVFSTVDSYERVEEIITELQRGTQE